MNRIAQEFDFLGYDLDEDSGRVLFNYRLSWDSPTDERGKELTFTETFLLGPNHYWNLPARKLLDLLYFISGVSYYKAGVPSRLNFKTVRPDLGEMALIKAVYSYGLGEMAYKNNLDLPALSFCDAAGNLILPDRVDSDKWSQFSSTETLFTSPEDEKESLAGKTKILLPFGGGIDSLTSLELLRNRVDRISLFIMSRLNDTYPAIENAAKVTKLPIVRLERQLDEKILNSESLGLLNGHVPVTAIVSAAAVLSAYLNGFNHVVMSNEKSASSGSLLGDKVVNHQWSKGIEFETILHAVVKDITGGSLKYFSLLRPVSELWIAERFSKYEDYLPIFRSCNRAFHLDPQQRLDKWCGVCDKCCFIDLILAPFLPKNTLQEIFSGIEPLALSENYDRFLALLGLLAKPFECVGDVTECRAALFLAAKRADRANDPVLSSLVTAVAASDSQNFVSEQMIEELLQPCGKDFIPGYLHDVLL